MLARGREVMANLNHKRRVRGVSTFDVIPKDMRRLAAMPCACCGATETHMDHVVPVSRGGSHGIGNLQPLCKSCNSSKGSKFLVEWRRDRALTAALSEVA